MKSILVTGSTGFIGSHLVRALAARGYSVTAFHRPSSDITALRHPGVRTVAGDILDPAGLKDALPGHDTVFHTAGMVSFLTGDNALLERINTTGTRNVVDACRQAGVARLVHTSSVVTIGYRTDGRLSEESDPYNWGPAVGYRWSKHLAEEEIRRGCREGLDAVIVNPSIVIGPGDLHRHGGSLLISMKRGLIRGYFNGGTNLASVHDVVRGHIAAAERGRTGERYILGGINVTYREMFAMAAGITGRRAPRIRLPYSVVAGAARCAELIAGMIGFSTPLPYGLLAGGGRNNWFSSEKAGRELGYRVSSVCMAMQEAYDWYASCGLC